MAVRTCSIVALLLASACGAPTSVDDAGPLPITRAQVRVLADSVARRSEATVGALGTARLGDDDAGHAWARLDPDDPGRGRGGYLLADGDRLWLVTYETDGRTEAWQGGAGARSVVHTQEHHHGHETVVFALRGGEPVVLDYELLEDTESGEVVAHHYAPGGVCATRCPPLRGYPTADARFEVRGPAASVEELMTSP